MNNIDDFLVSLFAKNNLKPKEMKAISFFNNLYGLKAQLYSMFDYENLPCRREFIENQLQRWGMGAFAKLSDGVVYFGTISWTEVDSYRIPKGKATFMTLSGGKEEVVEIGKNCVLIFNNAIRTPNLDILFYSNFFTEIDQNIKNVIKKSRLLPIPVVKDNKQKVAIDCILKDIENGNLESILQDNLLSSIGEADQGIKTVELTRPDDIQGAQYLSKLYDDILRRFWTKYGHSLSSASKMAQVSSLELEGYQTYSMIEPYAMLEERKNALEECNKLFGTNYSVKFSKAWEHLKEVEEKEVIEEGEKEDAEI